MTSLTGKVSVRFRPAVNLFHQGGTMSDVEFFTIMLCYTLLDLLVGVGLGIWIASKIVDARTESS